ncbi:MAG: thioredoxin domain-containing protein [Solirubrobacteraceae bacterium]|jgi:protein-disulfide isomerase
MASRKEQKEAARQARLEQERALAERAARNRRLQMLGGVVVVAVAVVVVLIIASGGSNSTTAPKPTSPQAKTAAQKVDTLLAGIPQDGTRLGSPSAPVTVTEFGDLECPVCKDFATGAENQLIAKDVRSGKVALVYRSLPTATANGPDPGIFPTQQAAALAAGQQKLGWYYIELFYNEQGAEDTAYVTPTYLGGLARQVPGLNYGEWNTQRFNPALTAQVDKDEQAANAAGYNSTPTIVVKGPKSQAQPIVGDTDYGTLESAIKSVS